MSGEPEVSSEDDRNISAADMNYIYDVVKEVGWWGNKVKKPQKRDKDSQLRLLSTHGMTKCMFLILMCNCFFKLFSCFSSVF